MRSLLCFLVLLLVGAPSVFSQTTFSLVGPVNARPGTTVSLSVCIKGGSPAGIQWTLGYPANYTGTAVAGTEAIAAGKTLACGTLSEVCLVYGINANLIADGAVATYSIPIPLTATPGLVPIPLTGLVAASVLGDEIPSLEGVPYSLLVLGKTDLNGDGHTDDADINLMVRQALRLAPCTGDQNGDAKCNLIDVILVIRGRD